MTRRGGLGAAALLVALACTSSPPTPESPQARYYGTQLQLHGSLSEGAGSMRGHNLAARELGTVDVLWWTDHDWRVARHTYFSHFGFESESVELPAPHRGTPWSKRPRRIQAGWHRESGGAELARATAATRGTAFEGQRCLALDAEAHPGEEEWGSIGAELWADSARLSAALAAEVTVTVQLHLAEPPGTDARIVLPFELSRQPTGVAELHYVLGGPPFEQRRADRDGRLIGEIPLPEASSGWQKLTLPLTSDATVLDLGSEDNSLRTLRLRAEARRGAAVSACFDDLHIETARTGEEVLAWQEGFLRQLSEEYGLVNHVGLELSYGLHMNAYLERSGLPSFEDFPHGIDPHEAVAWASERGGTVSYNHIFGAGHGLRPPAEKIEQRGHLVLEQRAFDLELLEVGYPERVRPLPEHLAIWDQLAARGVRVTAIGSSDSHDQMVGWRSGNNFISWIWAASPSREDLIAGLRQGRVFFGDPARFDGVLELFAEGERAMGRQPVAVHAPRIRIWARGTRIPAGCQLRWIVDGEVRRTLDPNAGDLMTELELPVEKRRFVRVELWAGDRGLAFTNGLYLEPAGPGSGERRPG